PGLSCTCRAHGARGAGGRRGGCRRGAARECIRSGGARRTGTNRSAGPVRGYPEITLSIRPPRPCLLRVTVPRIGQHVDNGRAPRSQSRSNSSANVARPFRPGPEAIKRLGYFAKVLWAEDDRVCRHLTGIIYIASPFHAEALVVDDDVHHWEVEP